MRGQAGARGRCREAGGEPESSYGETWSVEGRTAAEAGLEGKLGLGRGKGCLGVPGKIIATWNFGGGWVKIQDIIPFFNIICAYETPLFLLVLGE